MALIDDRKYYVEYLKNLLQRIIEVNLIRFGE
jgi:hypothetical protein